jgi:hypothetical protein
MPHELFSSGGHLNFGDIRVLTTFLDGDGIRYKCIVVGITEGEIAHGKAHVIEGGTRAPAGFLPLTPRCSILVALGDGESHGYAIMQNVLARTGGTVRLSAGTLYGAVSRLLEDGLIEESEERPDRKWTIRAAAITG